MRVKLKVLCGKNAGKEIKIPTPKCLVGRGDECHLRPKSDAISRRHCVIVVKDAKVFVRDLKSRNGTYINGEAIQKDTVLKGGEHLRLGPLEFEVLVDHSLGGEKKPVVTGIRDAAKRTADGVTEDTDISSWLDEADEVARVTRLSEPDTRQFRLDEAERVALEEAAAKAEQEEEEAKQEEEEKQAKSKKKTYGKLPQKQTLNTKDSREAAADMLRKFFNRR